MGWAVRHIEKLKSGKTVQFRPHGNSMTGLVNSGQLVTVNPVSEPLVVGSVVLCKVNGYEYLHKITAIDGERYQIGNNKGRINGWTSRQAIFGVCNKVE